MTDIREALERTARSVEVQPSDETVEADVRRGRTALARRRRARTIGWCAAGLAAVVVAGRGAKILYFRFGPSAP